MKEKDLMKCNECKVALYISGFLYEHGDDTGKQTMKCRQCKKEVVIRTYVGEETKPIKK